MAVGLLLFPDDLHLLSFLVGNLLLNLLYNPRLADGVVQEEGLDLLREAVNVHVHVVQPLDEGLQLDVLELLQALDDARTDVRELLHLVRSTVDGHFRLLLGHHQPPLLLILVLVRLVQDGEELHGLVLIVAVSQELLGLLIQLVVLVR